MDQVEQIKTVLLPVAAHDEDGVELARHALLAARPALADGARVDLVSTVPALSSASAGAAKAMNDLIRLRNEHVLARLHELADDAKKLGLEAVVQLIEGDDHPGDLICTAAEKLGSDWIAMSTHARKGLRKVLLGSVATRVVQAAKCPVLLVR